MSASNYLEAWIDSESAGQQTLAVKIVYIDMNDGCLTDGILFSQIVYWSGKTKDGKHRAQTMFGGHRWIVKEADEWYAECRVKDSTARESLRRIIDRGLVIKEVHRHHGKACTHLRINAPAFEERIKLALEGKLMPDCQKPAKRRKGSGLPKSSKAELPKSSNVYTEITRSENLGSEERVHSSDPTEPSQAQVSVSDIRSEVKAVCKDLETTGVVVERTALQKRITAELVKEGVAQEISPLRGVCLKEVQAVNALQETLIPLAETCPPSVSGNLPVNVPSSAPDNLPDTPRDEATLTVLREGIDFLKHNAHLRTPDNLPDNPREVGAALPAVPEGYRAVYDTTYRHLVPMKSQITLCRHHLVQRLHGQEHNPYIDDWPYKWVPAQCPDCAAKAAARQTAGKTTKAGKPAIYSNADLFDAIAAFSFKATEKPDVKAVGGRVGPIRSALCDYVVDKLNTSDPTPEQIGKVIQRVKEMPAWYDKTCKQCDRPQSPGTFMTWYIRYVQSLNGTAKAEGDGYFYDGERGAWMKREGDVLYKQGKQIDDWERVP